MKSLNILISMYLTSRQSIAFQHNRNSSRVSLECRQVNCPTNEALNGMIRSFRLSHASPQTWIIHSRHHISSYTTRRNCQRKISMNVMLELQIEKCHVKMQRIRG
ncbi:hypothetical protein KC19_9G073200 [Ceratodon purpureus]|uniref:Uncharacterized protein n=1 Tax=Ceratodon purpureus TaxID=3225 RepID=A0A8T0GV47_CERPU|nr:hypothetical protein KC19_9G073200 [Ceratodon purpureus]